MLKQTFKVQVFATDIDSRAIDVARAGVYPAGIAADITPERLARFFSHDPESGVYRIQKSIRDLLVFSEQDVIKDPPFSKLDLISCRNLLIYMDGELQKKLIPLFHYALNPGGALFLGTSETVGEFLDLFAPLDRKWKLYQRKEDAQGAHRPALGKFIPPLTKGRAAPRPSKAERSERKVPLRELAEQALLQEYTPASVVVNERGDILYIHGRTGRYLEPAPGDAGMNIIRMAREGLRRELATALRKAAARKETARYPGLRVKTNGDFINVNLTVRPLTADPSDPATDSGQVGDKGRPEATAAVCSWSALRMRPRQRSDPERPGVTGVGVGRSPHGQRRPGGGAGAGAADQGGISPDHHRGDGDLQRRAQILQRGDAVGERRIAVHQRGVGDLQGGAAIGQRGTGDGQLPSCKQKVSELSRANNDMNNLMAGTGVGTVFVDHQTAHPALYPRRHPGDQPDPDGRGAAGRATSSPTSWTMTACWRTRRRYWTP